MLSGYKLDKSRGSSPLYSQIEDILLKELESGLFSPGDIFYSEKEIMECFQVSRITVRQAVSSLAQKGFLEPQRGVGAVVKGLKIGESLEGIVSFSDEMKSHGILMETSFVSIEVRDIEEDLGGRLDGSGRKAYYLERVRNASSSPIVFSKTYLSSCFSLSLDRECYKHSLYDFLRREKNIVVLRARDTLEAILASEEVASRLDIKVASPVFKRTRASYSQDGRQIEYSVSYYPGSRYKYSIEL